MRREDKILYSLILVIGVALPVILSVLIHFLHHGPSQIIVQLLSVMVYILLASWIALALTGDGKHLTDGRWDGFSEERKKEYRELASPWESSWPRCWRSERS